MARTIQSTVSQDVLYLDASKANPLKEDMVKQLGIIATNYEAAYKTINKASKISGDVKKLFTKLATSCKNQSTYTTNKKKSLETKYNADVQQYTIDVLQGQYDALLARVEKLEKNEPEAGSK